MEKVKRPVIELPLSRVEKIFELVAAVGLLTSIFLLINYWSVLPDKVPSHFGVSGRADAWSGKAILIILPLVSLFLYTLLTLVCRKPQYCNYLVRITAENAERQYRLARKFLSILKAELIWVFTLINWASIGVAMERCNGLGVFFLPVFLIIVFGTIGIYIYCSLKTA
ncbi:MAG: hypothetical protein CVT49_12530 [candidate division Zixibacteria bacterium HGW-Zixibacteria-1]|nr:MAG: hypothetical protein CVT49_12530 [candidate division Zixibacteria bacterium HGW-Zixibacteria-1]